MCDSEAVTVEDVFAPRIRGQLDVLRENSQALLARAEQLEKPMTALEFTILMQELPQILRDRAFGLGHIEQSLQADLKTAEEYVEEFLEELSNAEAFCEDIKGENADLEAQVSQLKVELADHQELAEALADKVIRIGEIRAGVIYPLDFNQELDELEDLAREYAAL